MHKKAMTSNGRWLLGIVVGLIIILVVFRVNLNLTSRFSILPEGQNNHNTDCTFVTNIDPGESWDINDYQPNGQWIALDVNGSGMKTYSAYSFLSGINFCDDNFILQGVPYLNLNALGNFKMKYIPNLNLGMGDGPKDYVFVCYNEFAKSYALNQNISANLNCNQNISCIPNWNCNSWGGCISGTQSRNCVDENSCGTLLSKPITTQNCQNTCVPETCESLGQECGVVTEANCGNQLNCGTCPSGKTCDSEGACVNEESNLDLSWLNNEFYNLFGFSIKWYMAILFGVGLILFLLSYTKK